MTLKDLILTTKGYSSMGLYDKQGKLIGDLDTTDKNILKFQDSEVIENKLVILHNGDNTYIKMCVFLDIIPNESDGE